MRFKNIFQLCVSAGKFLQVRFGFSYRIYDRSFAFRRDRAAPPWLVGAGFSAQQVPALEAADWDVLPDAICTEDATHLPHREPRNEPA